MKERMPIFKVIYFISLAFILIPLTSLMTLDFSVLFLQDFQEMLFSALKVTLKTASISLLIIVLIGLPTSYVMAYSQFKGKKQIDRIMQLPLFLPPAVIGMMFLIAFGQNGWFKDFQVAFTQKAIVIIFVFVGLPLFISVVSTAFKRVHKEVIEAAIDLGCEDRQLFTKVIVPMNKSEIFEGTTLALARGLSEFGATIILAGNLKGVTQTLSLSIYTALEVNEQIALMISVVLLAVSLIMILLLERFRGER